MAEERDRELGLALRELDVPEHGPRFDAELHTRLEQRSSRRTWALAAAAVLAVLAGALAVVLPRGSDVASAAEIRDAVVDAFADARTISGEFVNRESSGQSRWRFVVSSTDSFRITGFTAGDLAYDARTGVESYSDGSLFVERVGLAPGPPDSGAAEWVVRRGLGSVVAALAADEQAKVEEVEFRGRPAWRLRTETGNPGEVRYVTVDRATRVPVGDVLFFRGRFVSEWRIERFAVNREPPGDAFTLRRYPDQQLTRYDMGFRPATLSSARALVDYEPLVPRDLPEGFELAEVKVAQSSRPTGDEQRQNPESKGVVSIRYSRGLEDVVVTTRRTGPDPSRWGDPVIGSSPMARKPERVRFEEGALRGVEGELVIDPNSVPHIWAVAGPLVVTIAGTLDREELIRIAESLGRT